MKTVDELAKVLNALQADGKGEFPIAIQCVEGGVTWAQEFFVCEGHPADGEIVWICGAEKRAPFWMRP